MKNHLQTIEAVRIDRFCEVTAGSGLQLPPLSELPTKVDGLYWIYTNYTLEDIIKCSPSTQDKAVDMAKLAKIHQGLSLVHKAKYRGFNLVYNGIGGGTKGLRERIQDEFNGGQGNASLGILQSSLSDLDKWRISYVIFRNRKVTADLDLNYCTHAEDLERGWRLEYGWPLLCRS